MQRFASTNLSRLMMVLLSSALFGADVTGRWTGTLMVAGREGDGRYGTALLLLKQEGAVLTGTAGPNEEDQKIIQQGKVEDGVITFTIQAHDGAVMKFSLKHSGDEINGDVRGEREGETLTAKLAVKREK